jgi:hypothetical protein
MASNDEQTALGRMLAYPLLDALANRRSRRFSLGATLPGGGLAYESRKAPVRLSKLEEAMLAFAAAGLTGLCLGDVPYAPGDQHEAGGGNVMAALTGRTGASADAVHGTALFVINDDGTYLLRRPQDFSLDDANALARLGREKRYEEVYDYMRLKVRNGRTSIRREVPFVFPFNKWSTNLPGATYFLPVSDLSGMYINVLLSSFDEQMAMFLVDERNNFRPAGIKQFGRSQGGKLHDEPNGNRVIPILGLESTLLEFLLAEQAFIVHNLSLSEQAMGLGGWTHFATATETGWTEALGFRIGEQRLSQIMHAGVVKRLLLNLTNQNRSYPHTLGLTVDGIDLIKPFCPPYYRSMEEAVLAYLEFKRANAFEADLKATYPASWKDPRQVQAGIPRFSDDCVEATIAYCTYVYDTYGRFPAYFGPLRTTLAHQAHHLDLDFYDHFYNPGAYTTDHAEHINRWHEPSSDGQPGRPTAAAGAPGGDSAS